MCVRMQGDGAAENIEVDKRAEVFEMRKSTFISIFLPLALTFLQQ